jgi:hypothetical protein
MEGTSLEPAVTSLGDEGVSPSPLLRIRAADEAARLNQMRGWRGRKTRDPRGSCVPTTFLNSRSVALPDGVCCFFSLSLTEDGGRVCHREIVVVQEPLERPSSTRSRAGVRVMVEAFISEGLKEVEQAVLTGCSGRIAEVMARHAEAASAMADRERAVAATFVSASRALVQASLFARRSVPGAEPDDHAAAMRLDDTALRDRAPSPARRLTPAVTLSAVLVICNRRRS